MMSAAYAMCDVVLSHPRISWPCLYPSNLFLIFLKHYQKKHRQYHSYPGAAQSILPTGGLDDGKYNGVGDSLGIRTSHPPMAQQMYVKQESGQGFPGGGNSNYASMYDPRIMNPALFASYNEVPDGVGDPGIKRSLSQLQMQSQIASQAQIMQENQNTSLSNNAFASLTKSGDVQIKHEGVDATGGMKIDIISGRNEPIIKPVKRTNSLELIGEYDPSFDPQVGGTIERVDSFDNILQHLEGSKD